MTPISTFNDHILSTEHVDYYYGFTRDTALFDQVDISHVKTVYSDILSGKKVNVSENRAVTHHQLRDSSVDHQYLHEFINHIHASKKFNAVCHIGVGGSFSGVKFVSHALNAWSQPQYLPLYFISSHDEDHIQSVLNQIDMPTTLFVIVSKSGATIECEKIVAFISQSYQHPNFFKEQCITVTVTGSPLDTDNYLERFTFDVGVGGRFSTTSYVGLVSLGLSYGPKITHDFLHGARIGDEHSTRDLNENIALIQAVVRFFQLKKHSALALVPYGEALSCLPSLMGQLICESLGKSVSNDSKRLMRSPAPYLMHGVGPDAQHTFFQQIHQGVDIIPVEFIYALPRLNNQCHILKQIIGQMLALHEGDTNGSLYHSFDGHRPSSLTIIKTSSVVGLGYFIALLENRIMFEGILHDINPFDQPGVELGKRITTSIDESGSIAHQIYDVVREQLKVPS